MEIPLSLSSAGFFVDEPCKESFKKELEIVVVQLF